MAPPKHCSPEQEAFLCAHKPQYSAAQKSKRTTKFLANLYPVWFSKWPLLEDATIVDEEQRAAAHTLAIRKKKEYIRNWFRNSTPKHHVAKVVSLTQAKTTRLPQLTQVYVSMCYKTKIAANLEADMKAKKAPRTDFLKYLRKHTTAALRLETPEMKKVVQAEYERRCAQVEESRKMAKNEVPHTPASYNTEIEAIPLHFQAFAFELAARTGWTFTLLAGGPDPSDGGCINTAAVHFGEDMDGNSYGKSALYPKDHLTPFANFLQTVYTQEQCDARALDCTPVASLAPRPEAEPLSANLELASITEPAGILPPNLLVCKPIEGVDDTSEPVTDTNGADSGVESLSDLAGSIPEANAPFWETFDFSSFEGAEPDIPDPSSGLMAESGYGSLMEELEAPLGVFSNYEKVTFPINNTVHDPQGSGPLQDFLLRPLTAPTYHAMPGAANTSVVALVQEPTNTTSIFSAPSPVINANAAAGSQADEDTNRAIANPGAIDKAINPQEGHVNESVTTPQEIGASTKTTRAKAKPQCKRKAPGTEQNEQPTEPVEKVNEGVVTPAVATPAVATPANTTTSQAKPRRKRKQADDSHLIVNTKRKRMKQTRTEVTALTDLLATDKENRYGVSRPIYTVFKESPPGPRDMPHVMQ